MQITSLKETVQTKERGS